ncbi:low temperature requirement protein LtrA [Micromonospora pisi]|uniref:Low temperature requirement protein LtrA n=1 Tax=Micromonospora pisi TaxID=589240 RepID=A0A495JGZ9_9ACTN|nr:low temperature requirement protein A [Micromonospora pisi]RKR88163.1 low temperature requirement protein LtrA [Micromonospora pisi]
MATGGARVTASTSEDAQRPAFLELFFDLVYVAALLGLATKLGDKMSWASIGQTMTLLLAFTMIWALTAWAGNRFDPTQPLIQPLVLGVMAASLLLAAAIPDAYGDRSLLFAITYVTIHLTSSFYYGVIERHGPSATRGRRVFFWESIAGVGWIVGALLGGTSQGVLWATAVGIEYLGAAFGWPVPRAGRSRSQEWRLIGERISERYRQFVIIALGVSLFVTGKAFGETKTQRIDQAWAVLVVFTITVLMWRIYIYRAGELMTIAMFRSANLHRIGHLAAAVHVVIVAGIVITAGTCQLVIEHPLGRTPPHWIPALLGGPALFLLGRGLLDYVVFGRVSRSRLVGLVLLAAVVPTTPLIPPIAITIIDLVILALIATANLLSTRKHPREPNPPVLGDPS